MISSRASLLRSQADAHLVAGSRLKEIRHPQAARSFTYTNAPSFIITAMAETSQGQGVTWDFTYDGIDRLQTAKRGDGQHYQYSFDKGDNLLSMAGPGGIREFNPSLGNKLNQAHYQHDPVGNRIADDRHRYTWDAENRLIKIAYKNDPQRQTEFRYDGQSRRVAIIETDGVKRTETKYTWCGNVICQAKDAQDRPVAYYFSQGVYRPQAKGNKKEYYARDHLGSVRDVLDEKGSPIARYDYDPYGNLTSDPNKAPEFGYAGMHYHAQSGLYLTKYRAYDPQSGRWLSRDPIGELGGINLYAYVGGNPVSFIDPLGLATVIVIDSIFPGHAGVLVGDPTGINSRTLYDPSGSYRYQNQQRPSGDMFVNHDFSFVDYIQHQINTSNFGPFGPSVHVYVFNTTPQEEALIKANMDQKGGCGLGGCSDCSSGVIDGIGPFAGLGTYVLPVMLKYQLDALVNSGQGQRMTGQEYLSNNPVDAAGISAPPPQPPLTIICQPDSSGVCPNGGE